MFDCIIATAHHSDGSLSISARSSKAGSSARISVVFLVSVLRPGGDIKTPHLYHLKPSTLLASNGHKVFTSRFTFVVYVLLRVCVTGIAV